MIINGTFNRFLWRNEKTGESRFTVKSNGSTVICDGIVQHYPKHIPIQIEGTLKKNKEYEYLCIDTVKSFGYDFDAMFWFLCGNEFPDIGQVSAKKIINNTTVNLFYLDLSEEQLQELSQKCSIDYTVINKTYKKLKSYRMKEQLYDFIKSNGGNYHLSNKFFNKFALDSFLYLEKNPYMLLLTDADYGICERIAKSMKIKEFDKKRVSAIVRNAVLLNHKNGNTRISLNDLFSLIFSIEKKAGCDMHTDKLYIAEEVMEKEYKLIKENGEFYVYDIHDYNAEHSIAEDVKRLKRTSFNLINNKKIEEIEKVCKVTYSKEQKEAFNLLNSTGIKIVKGGPGTGKTTFLNGILKKYEYDNKGKSIVLCAPTGCAARHMTESTGREANTIHKTLNIRPFEDIHDLYCKRIDADCIVVDECSMVDTYIMAKILSSAKNGALVILLGDADQLQSVDAGNILSDFIESGVIECYSFSEIFRQDKGNVIIENSRMITNGITNLKTDKNFVIKRCLNEDELIKKVSEIAESCYSRNVDFKLYTPSRRVKFQTGSIKMNLLLKNIKFKDSTSDKVYYGHYCFSVGDKVIFNTNNYQNGYYNGQEGDIINIQKVSNKVFMDIKTDDDVITLTDNEIDDIELGYAMTAHKSQGGETDNAIIIIPQKPASLLLRKLLYVEVTRAKQNVIILSEGNALEKSILNKMEIKRNTGLINLLQK